MTKIIMNGCLGRMGRVIADLVAPKEDLEIVAGVDYMEAAAPLAFPTYTSFADVKEEADVIIDFSNPKALEGILAYAKEKKMPVVLCTTGFSEEQKADIEAASKEIPVFFSANMSIGINLISELAKKAAAILYPDYNIEIVEMHHNQKLDAPSGTALMIADEIKTALTDDVNYEYNRNARREKRPVDEIGIHAVRGGTIVGDHEVMFCGPDEIIKISHHAASRTIFANGAVNAAAFLVGKAPGMYSMKDMLD